MLQQWRMRCIGNFTTTKKPPGMRQGGEATAIWYNGGMNPKEDGVTTDTFRIIVEPDEDRWRAYAPALEVQGASTWGYTREEALGEYPRGSRDDCRGAGRGRQVGAGRRCGLRRALGRGHGMTDIPWGALRSLTAREIISALIRDGFSLHNQRDRTSATVTRTVAERRSPITDRATPSR